MIFLVRHGRTETNAQGRLLGRSDPALDAVGQVQASALAAHLGSRSRPVRVVSSPLRRCGATAAAIAGAVGAVVEIDDRWIELDYGDFDGARLAELPADVWAQWRSDLGFRPPGGETLVELGARVRAACDELAAADAGGDVVVVSHVSPIKAGVAWALGVDDRVTWRLFVAPGSVTRIAVIGGRIALHGFNDTSMLLPSGPEAP